MELWSTARFNLGLSEREFWHMPFRLLWALMEKHTQHIKLYSVVGGLSMLFGKKSESEPAGGIDELVKFAKEKGVYRG